MLPSAVSDSRVHNILPNRIETDFQFSRASSATRVNRQGLIENVGYFGPELVQNGDFSELGPELVTNGDFSNGTNNWSFTDANGEVGFYFGRNEACEIDFTNTSTIYASPNIILTNAKSYKITLDYYIPSTNVSANYIQVRLGNTSSASALTPNLTVLDNWTSVTLYGVSNGTDCHIYTPSGAIGDKFYIDNVSVKQVDPDDDWILGSAWNITDKANFDYSATSGLLTSRIYQDGLDLKSGKKYKLTFDVTTTGSTAFWIGNSAGAVQYYGSGYTAFTTGYYCVQFDMPSDQTTLAFFNNNSDATLDNISLVEVQGDKPRLDYDPTNPTCPHLLLEPQSTNLITFSEDFNASGWTNQNTIDTANQTVSPDGANNGTQLTNTTSSSNYIYRQVTLSTSTDYSISVFVKKGTSNIARLDTWDTTGSTQGSIEINLDTETTSIITGTASFEKYPNDWYKLKVSFTSSGSLGTTYYRIFNNDGVNGSYIYMFGAQLEQQSYVTSYIPTAGAAETRVAETCTNAGNVDTFNSAEGVLYCDIKALANDLTYRAIYINDNDATRYIGLRFSNNSNQLQAICFDGANLGFVSTTLSDITNAHKIALQYQSSGISLYINGSLVGSDATFTGIAANQLDEVLFDSNSGTQGFYGKVKGLATYNRALTDTELYTITSTQYSAYSGMVAALGNYTIPC